jgi:pimeloyl-ACP methyl ester carboxylesterase
MVGRTFEARYCGRVVLVGHSYGGSIITEACNDPNVAALVYIAAFAPDERESRNGRAASLQGIQAG